MMIPPMSQKTAKFKGNYPISSVLGIREKQRCLLQAFDSVTIMFCGLQLMEAGTRADVMQTVAHINEIYSRIDRLLDSHRVYKVSRLRHYLIDPITRILPWVV